jgi:hypothetical protein
MSLDEARADPHAPLLLDDSRPLQRWSRASQKNGGTKDRAASKGCVPSGHIARLRGVGSHNGVCRQAVLHEDAAPVQHAADSRRSKRSLWKRYVEAQVLDLEPHLHAARLSHSQERTQ